MKYLIAFIVIIVAIIAVYSNSLHSGWHYDDEVNIGLNKNIYLEKLDWQNVKATWYAGGVKGNIYHPSLYRPVSMFSFALNYYFGGMGVTGFHIVNITVHVISAIFLFLFLSVLLTDYKRSQLIALLATLMWALNPVQLQAVTYIVQRMASMAGMFYIMAMYFWIQGRRLVLYKYYGLFGITALLAIGCKENAIMIFGSIFLYELIIAKSISKRHLLQFGVMAIVLGVILTWALQGFETFSLDKLLSGYERREFTLFERVITEPRIFFFYLSLLFFPLMDRLCLVHEFFHSTGFVDPFSTLVALYGMFFLIGVAIWKAREWPILSFCVLWFFLNHLIEGSIFPLELIYEHRNYIPAMLIFVPLAWAVVRFADVFVPLRWVTITLAIFILVGFGRVTYLQNDIWQTELKLWNHNIKVKPVPRAFFNLGTTYYKMGDWGKMADNWQTVVDFNEIYGTNYQNGIRIIPYGKVYHRANSNLRMLKFINKLGGKEAMASFRKRINRHGGRNNRLIKIR